MYKFQLTLAIESGTVASMDKYSAIPFVCELLLYPIVTILFLLLWGADPGIIVSVALIACLLLALTMNIPLTYSLIRHYTGQSLSEASLFETSMARPFPVMERQYRNEVEMQGTQLPQESQPKPTKRKETTKIDKRAFQDYFRKHKPYLNPNLTIYDLVEPLSSNRTYISEFINRVYGMSFSSYVNYCRFRELERLKALPSNKGKKEATLAAKAGFGKYRNYLYVKKQFSHQPEQPSGAQKEE
ncbi:MAG: hypothetical protein LUE93_15575 [Bacteroides sp.]|nr:hypothetical protein [Bacteroides sp.]